MEENPEKSEDFKECLNPDSFKKLQNCKVEPGLKGTSAGEIFQFERQGYFCVDSRESSEEKLVFNRAVTLRDAWAKMNKVKK